VLRCKANHHRQIEADLGVTINDRVYVAKQYSDPSRLRARTALYEFMVPEIDVFSAAFDTLELRGLEKILEVGCGEGSALVRLRLERKHLGSLIGCDISKGMIAEARGNVDESLMERPIDFLVSDAAALPFEGNRFDVVLSFFYDLSHAKHREGPNGMEASPEASWKAAGRDE
jgi:SAM-dependent methyltransferase